MSWALVVSVPFLVIPVFATQPTHFSAVDWQSWVGFFYVGVISMYLTFIAWYKGLALGGIAKIGQLQLLQPFITIAAAATLLNEAVIRLDIIAAAIVVFCVLVGSREPTRSFRKNSAR